MAEHSSDTARPAAARALDALHQGEPARAATEARAALAAAPEMGAALNILGLALYRQAAYADAAEVLQRARQALGDDSELLTQYGMALLGAGEPAAAAEALAGAVARAPGLGAALPALAAQVRALLQADRAESAAELARAWLPRWGEADTQRQLKLAQLAQEACGAAAAEPYYAELAERLPDTPAVLGGLGDGRFARRDWDGAIAAYRAAAAAEPDAAKRHHDVAMAAYRGLQVETAWQAIHEALACDGGHAPNWHLYAALALWLGEPAEAVAGFARAEACQPGHRVPLEGAIFALYHLPDLSPAILHAHMALWARRFADPPAPAAAPAPGRVPASPARRLRVGFLSGQFRSHPAGYFALPAFAHMPRNAVEVHALELVRRDDWLRTKLEAAADAWHELPEDSAACATALRQRELDVLVDLTGLMERNQLPRFGQRFAPVQAKWVGGQYGTTALPEMDLFVSDPMATPPGWESDFTEAVLRLPGGYTAYTPPPYRPEPTAPAADAPVTLGCFNKPAKICQATIALWAAILRARPQARLMLVGPTFEVPHLAERWRGRFAAHGVAGERLILSGQLSHPATLARYGTLDLALDPLAYSGGLTTCEALIQGVPVLTCPGRRFTARHAASRLAAAGEDAWMVADEDAYYEAALAAIDRAGELAAERHTRVGAVAASALMDGPRHGRELAHGLEIAWQRAQQGQHTRRPIDAGAPASEQVAPGPEPAVPWPAELGCLAPAGPP